MRTWLFLLFESDNSGFNFSIKSKNLCKSFENVWDYELTKFPTEINKQYKICIFKFILLNKSQINDDSYK